MSTCGATLSTCTLCFITLSCSRTHTLSHTHTRTHIQRQCFFNGCVLFKPSLLSVWATSHNVCVTFLKSIIVWIIKWTALCCTEVCVCVCVQNIFSFLKGLFEWFIYAHIIKNACFNDLNSTNAKQDLSYLTLCSLSGIRINNSTASMVSLCRNSTAKVHVLGETFAAFSSATRPPLWHYCVHSQSRQRHKTNTYITNP